MADAVFNSSQDVTLVTLAASALAGEVRQLASGQAGVMTQSTAAASGAAQSEHGEGDGGEGPRGREERRARARVT